MKFSHVALSCADPIATERFYTQHFGFQRARVVPTPEGRQDVFIKSGAVYLELMYADGPRPVAPPDKAGYLYQGVRHLAFQVDDVDATLAAMGDEAIVTLGPLRFDEAIPGWKTVWVADPDGNIVEISQGYVDQVDPPALA